MAELSWKNVSGADTNTALSGVQRASDSLYDRVRDFTGGLQSFTNTLQSNAEKQAEWERQRNTDQVINKLNQVDSLQGIQDNKELVDARNLVSQYGNAIDLNKINQTQASWISDAQRRAEAKDLIRNSTPASQRRVQEIYALLNSGNQRGAEELAAQSADILSSSMMGNIIKQIRQWDLDNRSYAEDVRRNDASIALNNAQTATVNYNLSAQQAQQEERILLEQEKEKKAYDGASSSINTNRINTYTTFENGLEQLVNSRDFKALSPQTRETAQSIVDDIKNAKSIQDKRKLTGDLNRLLTEGVNLGNGKISDTLRGDENGYPALSYVNPKLLDDLTGLEQQSEQLDSEYGQTKRVNDQVSNIWRNAIFGGINSINTANNAGANAEQSRLRASTNSVRTVNGKPVTSSSQFEARIQRDLVSGDVQIVQGTNGIQAVKVNADGSTKPLPAKQSEEYIQTAQQLGRNVNQGSFVDSSFFDNSNTQPNNLQQAQVNLGNQPKYSSLEDRFRAYNQKATEQQAHTNAPGEQALTKENQVRIDLSQGINPEKDSKAIKSVLDNATNIVKQVSTPNGVAEDPSSKLGYKESSDKQIKEWSTITDDKGKSTPINLADLGDTGDTQGVISQLRSRIVSPDTSQTDKIKLQQQLDYLENTQKIYNTKGFTEYFAGTENGKAGKQATVEDAREFFKSQKLKGYSAVFTKLQDDALEEVVKTAGIPNTVAKSSEMEDLFAINPDSINYSHQTIKDPITGEPEQVSNPLQKLQAYAQMADKHSRDDLIDTGWYNSYDGAIKDFNKHMLELDAPKDVKDMIVTVGNQYIEQFYSEIVDKQGNVKDTSLLKNKETALKTHLHNLTKITNLSQTGLNHLVETISGLQANTKNLTTQLTSNDTINQDLNNYYETRDTDNNLVNYFKKEASQNATGSPVELFETRPEYEDLRKQVEADKNSLGIKLDSQVKLIQTNVREVTNALHRKVPRVVQSNKDVKFPKEALSKLYTWALLDENHMLNKNNKKFFDSNLDKINVILAQLDINTKVETAKDIADLLEKHK